MNIYRINDMTEEALYNFPNTRDSDIELYLAICKEINPQAMNLPFNVVMGNLKDFGLPNIESVGRARRKLQSQNPELRASKEVVDFRYENFKEIKEYAIS